MEKMFLAKKKWVKPISIPMSKMKSTEEWKAEETEHHFNLDDIVSLSPEGDGFYRVTVKNMPFEGDDVYKLVSNDPRLEDLT